MRSTARTTATDLEVRRDQGRDETSWTGDGAGVVRLALGDNSELGGTVGGGYVRWNFFTGTAVTVGGEVWVRDGQLVPPGP